MEYLAPFLIVVMVIALLFLIAKSIIKTYNPDLSKTHMRIDNILLLFILLSHLIVFIVSFLSGFEDYYTRIDPVDSQYRPISSKQFLSIFTFYILNLIATFYVWRDGKKMPPLSFSLAICMMIYWMIICIPLAIQFMHHSDKDVYYSAQSGWIFLLFPLSFWVTNSILFIRIIRSQESNRIRDQYKNKFLNYLNNKLITSQKTSTWILIFFFPFLLLILCILMLFGQYPDSMVKVFTDTTTWTLSQKSHPPFLDHQGHYLCTVAACGSPQIVKPQRIGLRHGNPIIVNRQLSIANAFENLIEIKFPKTHRIIRKNYDKYGYALSKSITSRFGSNLTYILMKPLEWVFLVFIYLFSLKPEELIHKQYRNPS
jgi:hypothetical protein